MRISRLDLTRYGKFTDTVLDFPAGDGPDFHIIYGPNEAGKSTLLAGWSDLLFGIDTRSQYGFLHGYNAMQIGARLEEGAQAQEFRRIKRRTGTLLDGYGATLPDNALAAWIGTLTRDGYRQMFSLNDKSIEEGGDAILASKGELGEMLFSASAGLAGLSTQLDALRQEYEGFYREGARADALREAKRQLDSLAAEHRTLEVSVAQLRNLQRARDDADRNLTQAQAQRDAAARHVSMLEKLEQALPQRARLRGLQEKYAPLAHLHHASEDEFIGLQRIETALQSSAIAIAEMQSDIARRDVRIATEKELADPTILAHAGDITRAENLRSAFEEAEKDLPRRYEERAAQQQALARLMQDIGCGVLKAAEVIVPSPILAEMRGLLQRKSGLSQALLAAEDEARQARQKRDAASAALGGMAGDDEAALAALLVELRNNDPADALNRAERDLDEATANLSSALNSLLPWRGTAEALQNTPVPSAEALARWHDNLSTAAQEQEQLDRQINALTADISSLVADEETDTGTVISIADAAAARTRREAMWAAHLVDLTPATAEAFEQALREDDHINALLVETMANAKRIALDQVKLSHLRDALREAESARREAVNKSQIVLAEVAAQAKILGLGGIGIEELTAWCALRDAALVAQNNRLAAEKAYDRASGLVARAKADLAKLLNIDAESYAVLFAKAKARVDEAARREDARQHLSALEADLAQREEAVERARLAFGEWQVAWGKAIAGSILASTSGDAGVIVEGLGAIAFAQQRLDDIEDRIVKMERNRDAFHEAVGAVLSALGLPEGAAWGDVTVKLAVANSATTALRAEEEERRALSAKLAEAQERQAGLLDERDALAKATGYTGGDLVAHMALCREAARLRDDIATLTSDLARLPQDIEIDSDEALEQLLSEARVALQSAEDHKAAMISAQVEAKRAMDDVGGDDALTRNAAQRESLLLTLEDQARDYLRKRVAMMTFEAGLRRFRDQHQSTMLTQASDAFVRLTHGAYQGLVTQPQGNKEILLAQAADGSVKDATQMSKGTRFQLYLALRIAGYHALSGTRAMAPFIADDIMETFDDTRATAAMSLFVDMARKGQVIYLTHHQHLCDIARRICPTVTVHNLVSA